MPRFFSEKPLADSFLIENSDAVHISRSLRMKIGDEITLCHAGVDYFCEITSIDEKTVSGKVVKSAESKSEPSVKLTIFQAYPKQDKLELIIQKTTELGVFSVVPFISKRCVSRPDKKDFSKKLERFSKISAEAAKQSGRGIIPEILAPQTIDECIKRLENYDLVLICYENEGGKLAEIDFSAYKNIAVIIGSEGGFEREEVEKFVSAGATKIWLGERILRCETCPISITAIIMNLTGNM